MKYEFNKGSEWRKWDLHVHTKGTNKNDQFNSKSMDDFFETFFRKAIENEIRGIGITDYFSIENYLKTLNYVKGINSKTNVDGDPLFSDSEISFIKNIFIFPNVELRMLPCTSDERLINIHCLFNPEYVPELENEFFSSLENQDGIKMNYQGIVSYGKSLKSELSDEIKQFKEGLNNFTLDPKSLKELFDKKATLKENTIIVVSNSNKDGNSGYQKHYDLFEGEDGSLEGVRKTIYKISNSIFSANAKDIKYFLGKRLDDQDGVTEEEKKQKKN